MRIKNLVAITTIASVIVMQLTSPFNNKEVNYHMLVLTTTIAALVPNKPISQLYTVFASLGINFPIVLDLQ